MSEEHKNTFVTELKKLKNLPCVKNGRLIVGGPSVTDPIDRSKGFQIALVSYHENLAALAEYQASQEHHWLVFHSRVNSVCVQANLRGQGDVDVYVPIQRGPRTVRLRGRSGG